ncbi:nucleotidyltransferase family protein [Marinifilum sp.]|uniref:nucleotidyltransferase family protein n=1 Tax=Marinifilum sp. TaxID=2033137 RepID=UPI003BAA39D9
MKPTLLVLAAGMGSRYGGLKQVDPIGPSGETIIDYSIYDAIKAGFGKIVFVIREQFEEDFKRRFVSKLDGRIELQFVNQEIFKVPEGTTYREDREKPWGTAHAVLMAKDVIKEPFAVINADDFYGANAFHTMADFLLNGATEKENCMLGYLLKNTISENGSVSRGICKADEHEHLVNVVERTHIEKLPEHIAYLENNRWYSLPEDATVSMNFWGFTPNVFDHISSQFKSFITEKGNELKSEFYIPSVVTSLIETNAIQFKVLSSNSQWFGVTYKEDKEKAVRAIKALIEAGEYPNQLWK